MDELRCGFSLRIVPQQAFAFLPIFRIVYAAAFKGAKVLLDEQGICQHWHAHLLSDDSRRLLGTIHGGGQDHIHSGLCRLLTHLGSLGSAQVSQLRLCSAADASLGVPIGLAMSRQKQFHQKGSSSQS